MPASALGKPLLWYTEVVGVPTGMVASDGLEIGEPPGPARTRRQDHLRPRPDHAVQKRRSGTPPDELPGRGAARARGGARRRRTPRPTEEIRADRPGASSLETGALVAALPIVATQPGRLAGGRPDRRLLERDRGGHGAPLHRQRRLGAGGRRPDPLLHRAGAGARRESERPLAPDLRDAPPAPIRPPARSRSRSCSGTRWSCCPKSRWPSAPPTPASASSNSSYVEYEADRGTAQECQVAHPPLPAREGSIPRRRSATRSADHLLPRPRHPERWRPYRRPACSSGCRCSRRPASPTRCACSTRRRRSRTRTGPSTT